MRSDVAIFARRWIVDHFSFSMGQEKEVEPAILGSPDLTLAKLSAIASGVPPEWEKIGLSARVCQRSLTPEQKSRELSRLRAFSPAFEVAKTMPGPEEREPELLVIVLAMVFAGRSVEELLSVKIDDPLNGTRSWSLNNIAVAMTSVGRSADEILSVVRELREDLRDLSLEQIVYTAARTSRSEEDLLHIASAIQGIDTRYEVLAHIVSVKGVISRSGEEFLCFARELQNTYADIRGLRFFVLKMVDAHCNASECLRIAGEIQQSRDLQTKFLGDVVLKMATSGYTADEILLVAKEMHPTIFCAQWTSDRDFVLSDAVLALTEVGCDRDGELLRFTNEIRDSTLRDRTLQIGLCCQSIHAGGDLSDSLRCISEIEGASRGNALSHILTAMIFAGRSLKEILRVTGAIQDRKQRDNFLLHVFFKVKSCFRTTDELERVARAIKDRYQCMSALENVARTALLVDQNVSRFLRIANEIKENKALHGMNSIISHVGSCRFSVSEIVMLVGEIKDPDSRNNALHKIAIAMGSSGRSVEEILSIVNQKSASEPGLDWRQVTLNETAYAMARAGRSEDELLAVITG
ncbi:MAG: hypothetical protein KGI80_01140 [Verrucomicrobiota bacterium]|nr:hypothetical protein [Verrucomicrobiota bacterium]